MEKEYEKPLNPKTTIPSIIKTGVKEKKPILKLKVEHKKHVMSIMDTFIALMVVSPLIVGYWRGTWTLMDFYSNSFPPWESFLFGGALHLCFTIMRDGLQDLIKFKTNSWSKTVFAYSLRRTYTYLFSVACILHWRGGWVIYDEWLGIEVLPDGRSQVGNNLPLILGLFVVSLLFLGVLRCFRNILAAPFVIALDTKSSAFDFPTRYRVTISYTTLYAVNNNPPIENIDENGNMSRPFAEKLSASPVTIEKQVVEHISPRPFINDLRGASPSGFSPAFGGPPSTTSDYPQIHNHQIMPTRPNNIQDIIQYLTDNAHRPKELIKEQDFANSNRDREKFQVFGTIQGPKPSQGSHSSGFNLPRAYFPQDPFFAYKPQDPSDINLLAPNSFRFAPAILSTNFYKNRQKLLQEAADASKNPSSERLKKPISLTLNIYPSPFQDDGQNENRFRFQGPGLTPRYRYSALEAQRARIGLKQRRMVVHLNVYPGAGLKNNFPEIDGNEQRFRKPIE